MSWIQKWRISLGPGLLVAASGIGAGDMVIGLQAGFYFHWWLPLVLLLTCLLKYMLTEGVARWHLSTGTSVVEAWVQKLPTFVSVVIFFFFLLWSLFVAAALMSACGLAGNALFPEITVPWWGVIHSGIALILILVGRYKSIEKIAAFLILLMFVVIIIVLFQLVGGSLIPPPENIEGVDAQALTFAMLGAVGGSFTILSYGYWIKEKGWHTSQFLRNSRFDLQISYVLTFLFVGILIALAFWMRGTVVNASGSRFILELSSSMEEQIGRGVGLIFKIGFWGVVFSSLLAVWDGIPYIFEDFMKNFSRKEKVNNNWYQYFLFAIAVLPAVLLFTQSALRNILNYAMISSLFSLVLALSLLSFDRKKQMTKIFKNSLFARIILWLAVVSFTALIIYQLIA